MCTHFLQEHCPRWLTKVAWSSIVAHRTSNCCRWIVYSKYQPSTVQSRFLILQTNCQTKRQNSKVIINLLTEEFATTVYLLTTNLCAFKTKRALFAAVPKVIVVVWCHRLRGMCAQTQLSISTINHNNHVNVSTYHDIITITTRQQSRKTLGCLRLCRTENAIVPGRAGRPGETRARPHSSLPGTGGGGGY